MKNTLEIRLRIDDLFDSLGKEEEQLLDGIPKITRDPSLDKIIQNYQVFLERTSGLINRNHLEEFDNELYGDPKPQGFSSQDIEKFSILLGGYQDNGGFFNSGLYLSWLFSECNNNDIIIYSKHLGKSLDHLGYKNKGKVITIRGDVGEFVGNRMRSGKILVEGTAGEAVGHCMSGGEIHINSNVPTIVEDLSDEIYGGNIYHKGKQIVRDGELVK